jgi:hypothetical protein
MMQLTLDLSPILVNRTAAYDIALEVDGIARARPSAQVDYQFVGHRVPQIPPAEEQRWLRDLFFRKLDDPELRSPVRLRSSGISARDPQRSRTFYLDPLFTLFASPGPNDVVMCLDLSPITHPYWHAPNVSRLYDSAFSKVARSGCKVITISDNTADTFRANFGSSSGTIRTVLLYIPKSVLSPPVEVKDFGLCCHRPLFPFRRQPRSPKKYCGRHRGISAERTV